MTPGADADTLVKLLVAHAGAHPRRPAMREREKGIWRQYTRDTVLAHVRALALGLHDLGLGRGEKVAIISGNRPEAYWMIYATQAVGGVPVPVYQDAIAKEVQYVVDHSDARFVLAEDQEQVDKLVEARGGLPRVERIFYDDPKGMRRYDKEWLTPLADLEARGRRVEAAHPGRFDELVAGGRPDEVAIISYTSGTTGLPKGAMLTHRNMIAAAGQFLAREVVHEGDELLSYLPLAWVGETAWSLAVGTVRGLVVNFPETVDTVLANLRELGPHFFLAPPRLWEQSYAEIRVRIDDSTWLKRWIFHHFMPIGEEVARRRMERRPIPLWLRLRWLLGEVLLFAPLRDLRGASRARYAFTGGAPLAQEIVLFYRGLGVNLKQIYGQTENCAFCCAQPDDAVKLGTVGLPYPGVELRLTDEGEIISRSPACFAGYYKSPEATGEAVRGGWLYSGDAGFFDRHHPCPAVPGEQAQVQPLREGGGRRRPGASVRRGHDQHRHGDGRQVGRAPPDRLHHLRGPHPEAGGPRVDHRRGGARQPGSAAGDPHPPVRAPPQGARPRRRRDHPDPQGAAPRHRREVRRVHRGLLRRRGRGRGDDHRHLRGRPPGDHEGAGPDPLRRDGGRSSRGAHRARRPHRSDRAWLTGSSSSCSCRTGCSSG